MTDRLQHQSGRALPPIHADEIPMVQVVLGFASYLLPERRSIASNMSATRSATRPHPAEGRMRPGKPHPTKGYWWTMTEETALREAYARGGVREAVKALPHRNENSIIIKAKRLHLAPKAYWTTDDEERLRSQWGIESLLSIAKMLGRTRNAVYFYARKLGLPSGAPPGWEYIGPAAARNGFRPETLVRILRWSGVRVIRPYSRPCKSNAGSLRRIAETSEIDDAVAQWLDTETLTYAAGRLNVSTVVLRRMCREAGVVLQRFGKGTRSELRAMPADFDRAFERRHTTVGITEASKANQMRRQTLSAWLREEGVHDGGRYRRFDPAVVKAVIAKHRPPAAQEEAA